jgi:hypothetical protein
MMIWFNCCSIPQSTCTPAPYTSFYISTDNALNVINHDPTLSTLRGCIGTFDRASTQIVSKPHPKFPNGAPRVFGTADRCMMLNLGGFGWLGCAVWTLRITSFNTCYVALIRRASYVLLENCCAVCVPKLASAISQLCFLENMHLVH